MPMPRLLLCHPLCETALPLSNRTRDRRWCEVPLLPEDCDFCIHSAWFFIRHGRKSKMCGFFGVFFLGWVCVRRARRARGSRCRSGAVAGRGRAGPAQAARPPWEPGASPAAPGEARTGDPFSGGPSLLRGSLPPHHNPKGLCSRVLSKMLGSGE